MPSQPPEEPPCRRHRMLPTRREAMATGIAAIIGGSVYMLQSGEEWPSDDVPLQKPEPDLREDASLEARRQQYLSRHKEFENALDDFLTKGGELGSYIGQDIKKHLLHYVNNNIVIHFCPAEKNGSPPFCKIGKEQKDLNSVVNLFTRYAALCRAQNALSKDESSDLPKMFSLESLDQYIIAESHKRSSNPTYEKQLQTMARIIRNAFAKACDFCDVSPHYKDSKPAGKKIVKENDPYERLNDSMPAIGESISIPITVIVENPYCPGRISTPASRRTGTAR